MPKATDFPPTGVENLGLDVLVEVLWNSYPLCEGIAGAHGILDVSGAPGGGAAGLGKEFT